MYKHRKYVSWLAATLALALVVLHAAKWHRVRVDGITLGLLALLVAIPYLDYIRKLKLGEFEAEITPQEVEAVKAKTESELPPPEEPTVTELDEYEDILNAVREDPPTGLFKLRFQMEQVLSSWVRRVFNTNTSERSRTSGLQQMALLLRRFHEISPEVVKSISSISPLLNRAIHGEYIRKEDAEELAEVGIRVLEQLSQEYRKKLLSPVDSEDITPEQVTELMSGQYRVTTVLPLVQNPRRNTYFLDQNGLDFFLDSYDEYAEFIVGVVRVS